MAMPPINELYAAIAAWALGQGVRDLGARPGLWSGRTREKNGLGPIDVDINPHPEKISGLPPFHIKLSLRDYFPGLIAVVGPFGGEILASTRPGEDERGLIAHFKAQTPEMPLADS